MARNHPGDRGIDQATTRPILCPTQVKATLPFIRRFLLHVLPRGFHRIRHYGLLASSARKTSLALARELLHVAAPVDDGAPGEQDDFRPPCPCCGGRMIVIAVFERWRQPRGPPDVTATNRETAS